MSVGSSAKTGSRIRERRIDMGLRQADLAKAIGISASYLNLIEHNRRRIAGRLLADIARALEVEATLLLDGADRDVLEQMQAAAVNASAPAEIDRAEDLASRFPGWADLICEQTRRISALETKVQELSDRMSHDPALAASLHSVISSVTSIRSTASILTSDETLDADWQSRFHKNIHDDAVRLAGNSESLISYLEAPKETSHSNLPRQIVEEWVLENHNLISHLETSARSIGDVVEEAGLDLSSSELLKHHLKLAMNDASEMPMKDFARAAKNHDYRPRPLADVFGVSFAAVLRRMSVLSPEAGHPPMGLTVCDAAGAILFQKSAPEYGLSRAGNACPRWPIFEALGQPGRPIERHVELPTVPRTRFVCYAVAEQSFSGFEQPPMMRATMLVIPNPPEEKEMPLVVGPTCRICAAANCPSRREMSVLASV